MNVAVDFKNVDIVFGAGHARCACHDRQGRHARRDPRKDRQCAGLRRRQPDRQRGRDIGPDGPVRLRQVDAAARRQPAEHRQRAARCWCKDGDKMVDVVSCDEATLRRLRQKQVAMVFQQFGLLPWRTVEENVGLGLELAGMPEAERKERVATPAQAGQPRPVGEEIRARAVGRHAAARRPGPRLRHRSADPVDGRAVLGARSADPHQAAGRAAAAAGER